MRVRTPRRSVIVALVAAFLGYGVSPADTKANETEITLGDFVILYAEAVGIKPVPPTGETAAAALRAAGVPLPGAIDLARPLTQAALVDIGRARGVRLSSRHPQRRLGRSDADSFLTFLAARLGRHGVAAPAGSELRLAGDQGGRSGSPPGDPASRARTDRGKKKGRPFTSPSEPGG